MTDAEQTAWDKLRYAVRQQLVTGGKTITLAGAAFRERGIPTTGLSIVSWDASTDTYVFKKPGLDGGDNSGWGFRAAAASSANTNPANGLRRRIPLKSANRKACLHALNRSPLLPPHQRIGTSPASAKCKTACEFDILDESIAENGFYKPVVASSESGYILAGHGTFERAIAAGYAELPVYWLEGLSLAQELKILAADNKTSDASPGYDEKMLAELLQTVQSETGGFEGTGYTQESFDEMIESAAQAILMQAGHEASVLRNEAKEQVATLRNKKTGERNFASDLLENQGKLDQKKHAVKCPKCGS